MGAGSHRAWEVKNWARRLPRERKVTGVVLEVWFPRPAAAPAAPGNMSGTESLGSTPAPYLLNQKPFKWGPAKPLGFENHCFRVISRDVPAIQPGF